LTDLEWQFLDAVLPPVIIPENFPDPTHARREIFNGIRYRETTGCQWRMMPHDLPPWQTVYTHFAKWRKDGTLARANDALRRLERCLTPKPTGTDSATASASREAETAEEDPATVSPEPVPANHRDPEPSVGIIDSQSVKGTSLSENGFDGGKKVNGRKRHVMVDVLGIVLAVVVTSANVQDRDGLTRLTHNLNQRFPKMKLILVDAIYNGEPIREAERKYGVRIEVREKDLALEGFCPIRQRWVVERTFGLLGWDRLLSRCYERLVESEEAWVYLSSIRRLLQRVVRRLA
jgi:putative transposase